MTPCKLELLTVLLAELFDVYPNVLLLQQDMALSEWSDSFIKFNVATKRHCFLVSFVTHDY